MPYRRIYNQALPESLLDHWNWLMVSEALAVAQNRDGKSPASPRFFMATGDISPSEDVRRLRPDWAGVKRLPDCLDQPLNILPGDTKLNCKWHSSRIETGDVEKMGDTGRWMPAIRQIYTYCTKAHAQYGYLITDQELLAVKINWLLKASRKGEAPRPKPDGLL